MFVKYFTKKYIITLNNIDTEPYEMVECQEEKGEVIYEKIQDR